MKSVLLQVEDLTAWYKKGTPILSHLSFHLTEHETVGLIGLNGAGKTTLLRVLSGLLDTFQWSGFQFRGQSQGVRERAFRLCRYTVFEEDQSFSYFTLPEYLAYVFAAYEKKIPDLSPLIQGFQFEPFLHTLLKDLSTGARKKAFLITAFALRPSLLLLDEPVNGLDFQSTEYLYQLISGYREYGTILFSSHILESITLTCDRVFVLENGQIRRTFGREEISGPDIREALYHEANLQSTV